MAGYPGGIDTEGGHDAVSRDALETSVQVYPLHRLKHRRGGPSMNLSRFLDAQELAGCGYATALHELCTTGKQSHWIWYIFPQLAGLGSSPMARQYALASPQEAAAFLKHPVLGPRLLEVSRAVAVRLAGGASLNALMGSTLDAHKLVSSMTLFHAVARQHADQDPSLQRIAQVSRAILDAAKAEGFPPCAFTLGQLAAATEPA